MDRTPEATNCTPLHTRRKPIIRVIASMASAPITLEMNRADRNVSQIAIQVRSMLVTVAP